MYSFSCSCVVLCFIYSVQIRLEVQYSGIQHSKVYSGPGRRCSSDLYYTGDFKKSTVWFLEEKTDIGRAGNDLDSVCSWNWHRSSFTNSQSDCVQTFTAMYGYDYPSDFRYSHCFVAEKNVAYIEGDSIWKRIYLKRLLPARREQF